MVNNASSHNRSAIAGATAGAALLMMIEVIAMAGPYKRQVVGLEDTAQATSQGAGRRRIADFAQNGLGPGSDSNGSA